eukprot:1008825-Prorocentrum_minimum.AAC.1
MTHVITRIEFVDPLPHVRTPPDPSEPLRTLPNPPNSKPGNARIPFPETPAGDNLSEKRSRKLRPVQGPPFMEDPPRISEP